MILVNQIRCRKCGDTPYSAHRHDFSWCKCGSVAVDGGMDYLRRVGDMHLSDEISICMDNDTVVKLKEKIQWCKETKRNDMGLICAFMRVLRDEGVLK